MNIDLVNHAVTHLFLGFSLALINVVLDYFVHFIPRFITVLNWRNVKRALIAAYLIALVLEVATSPLYRSYLQSAYVEIAWSPYQAVFDVLGVVLMDLIIMAWTGARRGAEIGGKQFGALKTRAGEELSELNTRVTAAVAPEDRETYAARRKSDEDATAQAAAERQKRMEGKLKDY